MRIVLAALLSLLYISPAQAALVSAIENELKDSSGGKAPAIVVSRDDARAGGLSFRRAEVTAARVRKLSADASVVAVLPNKPLKVAPVPGPRQNWFEDSPLGPVFSSTDPAPTMWKAKDLHGAPAAWAAGYTGKGVKIAVMDEGIDFANPDLQGCQARVKDPSSSYYGWPIVFDPSAMSIYASDGVATGGYCDTSDILTNTEREWRGKDYILPGTSKSGIYHVGSHNSYWLPFLVGSWGSPTAVLVADEHTAGVYDTVYVDLDKDCDFRNDKPCRRGDEISIWDYDKDGLADFSGGMVYFIADGVRPIPASDWLYHLAPPDNGCLVCFAGSFGKSDMHGTLVTSAIAARGAIGCNSTIPQKPDDSGGMVYGVAPGAEIIQVGNIYTSEADIYDALQFCINGYDGKPGTGDEPDIVNMSFGLSAQDDDGWDFLSRYVTSLNKSIVPRMTFVTSSGNGGPGYGTVSSPGASPTAITVGASTLYGSTDWLDPIKSAAQILSGDVQQWSDRGPSSLGQVKPEVVATGCYATGDVPIYGYGEGAWTLWAGTSLSAPITSGIVSLIYQAYKEKHGVYPTFEQAKTILMSGSDDLSYGVLEQGAGMVNAAKSVRIASGTGLFQVTPSTWSPGGYAGARPEAFPHVLKPGEKDSKIFTVTSTGIKGAQVIAYSRRLVRTAWSEFSLETKTAREDPQAEISKPDYLIDIARYIPKNTEMLRIRVSFLYGQFCISPPISTGIKASSVWLASAYDWTDVNSNGRVWTDSNHNGAINEGEFETGELNSFMLANSIGDVLELSVKTPLKRMHNGLFLGLIHGGKSDLIPKTALKIEIEAYSETSWDWLSAPRAPFALSDGSTAQLPVTVAVPQSAEPGIYTGSLVVRSLSDKDPAEVTVPISVTVAPNARNTADGPIVSGQDGIKDTYDNGRIFGAFDWGWREESGDWRFYYLDLPPVPAGAKSYLLANAQWDNVLTDNDLLIYRPDATDFFASTQPDVFGTAGMTLSGASKRMWLHDGLWLNQTNSTRTQEWVAGECRGGLNMIQLHNVLSSGLSGSEPFTLSAGVLTLQPASIELSAAAPSTSIAINTTMALSGIAATAYGPAVPTVYANQPAKQDYQYDPKYSSWWKDITAAQAGEIAVSMTGAQGADLDMYLLYDYNKDGVFDWNTDVVASSAGTSAAEKIAYYLPKDGRYRIAVHGYKVPSPTSFDISVAVVQGHGMKASIPYGKVRANSTVTMSVTADAPQAGALGVVFLGPYDAPFVLPVPVTIK